jgi:alpha-tubulin suppressor-like RCC1 family protein
MKTSVTTMGFVLTLWTVSATAQDIVSNLVQNGSFENLGPHYNDLSPWAGEGVILAVDEPGRAADGNNFVTVNRSLYQDIPTVPGQDYVIRFAFGGNEGTQVNNTPMSLLWDGQEIASIPVTPVSPASPQWRYLEYQAVAESNTTRLTFSTLGGEAFPYVDNVSVRAAGWVVGWGGNNVGQITPCADGIVSMAAGYEQSLLLKRDGTVCASGEFYVLHVPAFVQPGLSNAVQVAAGWSEGFALKSDGTVVAWGTDDSGGQLDVPPDLSNVVQITAGPMALKADGTVVAWGAAAAAVPPGLRNIVAVDVGGGGLCEVANGPAGLALGADGTLFGWGWAYGLDTNHVVVGVSNVVAISAGYDEWLALEADGTVKQVQSTNACYWAPPGLSNIVAVSASPGSDHHVSLALKTDGTVVGWGFNFYGGPDVPPGLSGVVAVAAGAGHCLALVGGGPPFLTKHLVNRSAVLTGKTYFRAEATGAWPLSYQWRHDGTNLPGETSMVLALTNVQASQAGEYSVVVANALGSTTSEAAKLNVVPVFISSPPEDQAAFIGGGAQMRVAAQGEGVLGYQWRHDGSDIPGATDAVLALGDLDVSDAGSYSVVVSNSFGAVLSRPALLTVSPVLITSEPQDQVTFLGGPAEFGVGAQGVEPLFYQWYLNGAAVNGGTNANVSLFDLQPVDSGTCSVIMSNAFGAVRSSEAKLAVVPVTAWGTLDRNSVPTATNVLAIAAAGPEALVCRSDGTWLSWGGAPQVPTNLTDIIAVSGSSYMTLGLRDNGTVLAWGNGFNGDTNLPAGLTNVVAIAAQYFHGLALTADGRVAAWGDLSTVPTGLTDVVSIATGLSHSLALKSDGNVVAWGDDDMGQTNVPPGIHDAVAIAAGWWYNLVLRADGTVLAFGSRYGGETDVPPGLSNVVAVACGSSHSLALEADGTVVAWGLGSSYNQSAGQAMPPHGLKNVNAIAAGDYFSIALQGSGPPEQRLVPSDLSWEGGSFRLSLKTRIGRVYRLEYRDSLGDGKWSSLPLVAGTGRVRTLGDDTAHGSQRFYRVRSW